MVQSLSQAAPLSPDDPLAKFPPRLDPVRWSSGLPRLLLSAKDKEHGLAAGAQLRLLRTDTSGLKAALRGLSEDDWGEETQRALNAWIDGRARNLNEFKPGARSVMLVFSDQHGGGVLRFPWYDHFKQWVEPWLVQVLGPGDLDKVMRLQLAFMPPHSDIKRHMDSGGYAAVGHRIHVVVQSNPDVAFHVCESRAGAIARNITFVQGQQECPAIHVEEGLVFELNNRLLHYVTNGGDQPRIHLILDAAETPRSQQQLRVGGVCRYDLGRIMCPPEALQEAEGAAAAVDASAAHEELRR